MLYLEKSRSRKRIVDQQLNQLNSAKQPNSMDHIWAVCCRVGILINNRRDFIISQDRRTTNIYIQSFVWMILLADEYRWSIQIFFHKYFSFRNSLNKYLKMRYKFPFIKSFIEGFSCLIFKYLFRIFLKERYLWKNIWIL